MINITLDQGNAPSVLAALNDSSLQDKLVKVAAETYVDETLSFIGAGRSFTTRTGILEQSIGWVFNGNGSASVFANAEYAAWVEEGTKPHVIEPKPGGKALKIPSGNGFFFAKKVEHPGSKAHPFFFADRSNREDIMQNEMISVLATTVDRANV